jgi:hypothetical protein
VFVITAVIVRDAESAFLRGMLDKINDDLGKPRVTVPIPEILRVELAAHIERTGRTGKDLLFGRTASSPFTDSHMRDRARVAWSTTCRCGHVVSEHRDDECDSCASCACGTFEALAAIGFQECRVS